MLAGLSYALHNAKNSPPDESTRRVIEEVLKSAFRFLVENRHSNLEASIHRMLIRAMRTLNTRTHEALLLRVIHILSSISSTADSYHMLAAISTALDACYD